MDLYIAFNLVVLVFLLLCSMFFSAVETSLLSFPKPMVQQRMEEPGLLGLAFREWHIHPNRLLTTMLIGNNGVNIASTTLVAYMAVHLSAVNGWSMVATGTVTSVLITFTIIVFGEVVPKVVARSASVRMASLLIIPLYFIDKLMTPFTWLLVKSIGRVLHRVGPAAAAAQVTEEDIKQMMEIGEEAGTIHEDEKEMIDSIFRFSDTPVNKVMIPRTQMVAVELSTNLDELVEIIIQNGFSRMPVYKGTVDNIVGVMNTRDLLAIWKNRELIILKDLIHKPYFVPESMRVDRLLKEFQKGKIHIAIVVDEFGGTAGLVTLEDLVEEIIGDIKDEYDVEEKQVVKQEDGSWVAEAAVPLNEVNEMLGLHLAPKGEVTSLGGYVMERSGKVPRKGLIVEDREAVYTVLEASDKKVSRVKILKRAVPLEVEPESVAVPRRRKKRIKLPPKADLSKVVSEKIEAALENEPAPKANIEKTTEVKP
jgi:CBS domain containing-hemolysin-like protein